MAEGRLTYADQVLVNGLILLSMDPHGENAKLAAETIRDVLPFVNVDHEYIGALEEAAMRHLTGSKADRHSLLRIKYQLARFGLWRMALAHELFTEQEAAMEKQDAG